MINKYFLIKNLKITLQNKKKTLDINVLNKFVPKKRERMLVYLHLQILKYKIQNKNLWESSWIMKI